MFCLTVENYPGLINSSGKMKQKVIHYSPTQDFSDVVCYDGTQVFVAPVDDMIGVERFNSVSDAIYESSSEEVNLLPHKKCETCFAEYDKDNLSETLMVHVIVFAEGIMCPQIAVTLDAEYAQSLYLLYELQCDHEEDVLSWQQIAITQKRGDKHG